jgi:hypothetical protein
LILKISVRDQYDPDRPDDPDEEDEDDFFSQRLRAGPNRERRGSIKIDERDEFAGEVVLDDADLGRVDALAREMLPEERARSPIRRRRSMSFSSNGSSDSLLSRVSQRRDRRPADRRRKPSPSSPRRWDRDDSWIAPPSVLDRKWNEADSWVDQEMLKEVEEEQRLERERTMASDKGGKVRPSGTKTNDSGVGELLENDKGREHIDVAQRGMRGWGEPGDADEAIVLPDSEAVPVDTVQPVRVPLALRIFGTGAVANDEIVAARSRDKTPEQERVDPDDVLSEEEDVMLDAQVWGTEDAIDLDLLAERKEERKKRRESEAANQPIKIVAAVPEDAAATQARQAIINNAHRRAEKKEQLLAKLIRAKMQLRVRKQIADPIVYDNDEEEDSSASSTPEQEVVPDRIIRISPITEDQVPSADAVEAEARAKAKAKLRMRLMQEKKKQQQQQQQQPPPKSLQVEVPPSDHDTRSAPPPLDRTAMLRERLLKARQQKQAVSIA